MSHNAHKPAALSFLLAISVTAAACAERDHSVTIPLPKRSADIGAEATAEAMAVKEPGSPVRAVSHRGSASMSSASGYSLVSAEAISQPSGAASALATSDPTASASVTPSSEPALAEPTASAATTASAEAPATEPSASAAAAPPSGPAAGQLGSACVWNTDCDSNKCWWQVCTSRAIGAGCTFDGDCDSKSCGWDHKCRSRGAGSSCGFDNDCNSGKCVAEVCK